MKIASLIVGAALVACVGTANAGYTFTQSNGQTTTYGTQLNFDEAGGPTGVVAANAWQPNYGLDIFTGSANSSFVGNLNGTYPWVSNNNTCTGNYGIYLDFNTACDGLSFQAWDDSGPPTFMGGGLYIYLLDANYNIIDGAGFTPAWGGLGNSWFNVTGTGGGTFDFVLITGNSFFPTTVIDNLSWNTVPGPGAMALLALGLAGRGRRRA